MDEDKKSYCTELQVKEEKKQTHKREGYLRRREPALVERLN